MNYLESEITITFDLDTRLQTKTSLGCNHDLASLQATIHKAQNAFVDACQALTAPAPDADNPDEFIAFNLRSFRLEANDDMLALVTEVNGLESLVEPEQPGADPAAQHPEAICNALVNKVLPRFLAELQAKNIPL